MDTPEAVLRAAGWFCGDACSHIEPDGSEVLSEAYFHPNIDSEQVQILCEYPLGDEDRGALTGVSVVEAPEWKPKAFLPTARGTRAAIEAARGTPESLWASEHGADYNVPRVIAEHPSLTDESWHNDVCPRFTGNLSESIPVPSPWGGGDIHADRFTLWVEHPDDERREAAGGQCRFFIFLGWSCVGDVREEGDADDPTVDTDSLKEILAWLGKHAPRPHDWECPCEECEQTRAAGLEYFDPAEADEMLTEAGWKVGDEGAVLGRKVLAYFNEQRSPKDFVSVRSDGRIEAVVGGSVMVVTKAHERQRLAEVI